MAFQSRILPHLRQKKSLSPLFLILIVLTITGVEYVFVYMNAAYGLILALLLTILIYVSVSLLKVEKEVTKAAESIALVPLYISTTSQGISWDQFFCTGLTTRSSSGFCLTCSYDGKLLRELEPSFSEHSQDVGETAQPPARSASPHRGY